MYVYILLFIVVALMTIYYMRNDKPIVSIIIGSGSGLIGMTLLGFLTTGLVQLNILTILMSLIAGIPGLITIILLGKFIV